MLAALTSAISPTRPVGARGCSCSSSRGRGHHQADHQRALERGQQPVGPDRQPLGQVSCSAIAASTVSWAGQTDSDDARRRVGGAQAGARGFLGHESESVGAVSAGHAAAGRRR